MTHRDKCNCTIGNHLLSTYAKFSEKLTFHGVRNVCFSENFGYVPNDCGVNPLWNFVKNLIAYFRIKLNEPLKQSLFPA